MCFYVAYSNNAQDSMLCRQFPVIWCYTTFTEPEQIKSNFKGLTTTYSNHKKRLTV